MANDYRAYVECDYNSIYHSGIKGMRWGMRRYQNEDGTLTEAGKKRYGKLYAAYRSRGATKKQAANAIKGYHRAAKAVNLMSAGTVYTRARLNNLTRGQAAAAAALNYGASELGRKLLDKHVAPKLITKTRLGDITETSFKNQRKREKKKKKNRRR